MRFYIFRTVSGVVTVGQRREVAMQAPGGRAFHVEGTACPQAQGGRAPAWSGSSEWPVCQGGAVEGQSGGRCLLRKDARLS